MRSHEHRAVGDIATGGAMVNLAGDPPEDALWLTFGDVVALSGDFFPPDVLFALARVPGHGGTRLDTSDELVGALKVATVDEAVTDHRFEPGGDFGHFAFSPRADRTDVERAVRDRYLSLAAVNDDHFVAPGPSDARSHKASPPTGRSPPSAPATTTSRWPTAWARRARSCRATPSTRRCAGSPAPAAPGSSPRPWCPA